MNKDKQRNYKRIRVSKDDDLAWVKNIINDLWWENKITTHEGICFIDSLGFEEETK